MKYLLVRHYYHLFIVAAIVVGGAKAFYNRGGIFISPFRARPSFFIASKYYPRNKSRMAGRRRPSEQDDESSDRIEHVSSSFIPSWMNEERTRVLTSTTRTPNKSGKSILYWMQRDMRTSDNWALLFASHLSKKLSVPLHVMYIAPPPSVLPQPYTKRYVTFLIEGLQCVETELEKHSIPFEILLPENNTTMAQALSKHTLRTNPSAIVCDMSPLRHFRLSKEEAASHLDSKQIPLYQVDAHNILPVWHVTDKREVGARTLRKKIHNLLPDFMTHFPELKDVLDSNLQNSKPSHQNKNDVSDLERYLQPDTSVPALTWAKGGTEEGMKQFQTFIATGLKKYDTLRNDPNQPQIISNLSPWINFGHVSFQRLALNVRKLGKYPNGTSAFIEEGVVRRELSDNFIFYTEDDYDSLQGAAGWARESLEVHEEDEREWIFSLEQLEKGETHDDLWNASQLQLVKEGKLHGFLRMYWAKKILEWTPSPSIALQHAQYLNDKYAIDGNDPNGYVGVGWSVMGIHDMGWKERPIFGKIRFMNYNGCKRKFKVDDFVKKYPPAKENAMKVLGKESGGGSGSKEKKSGSGSGSKEKKSGGGSKGKKRKTPS